MATSKKVVVDCTLEQWGIEFTFRLKGDFIPGAPGVHTLSNGDPGYPPDPPEFDPDTINLVAVDKCVLFPALEVSSDDWDSLVNKFWEQICEQGSEDDS